MRDVMNHKTPKAKGRKIHVYVHSLQHHSFIPIKLAGQHKPYRPQDQVKPKGYAGPR